jgi:predicted O-methyltransferase YrrM
MPWTGEELVRRARAARRLGRKPSFVFAADIPSAVTEAECRRLAELAEGRRVLEIGSYLGRSTIALASTAEVVHTIDFHPPDHAVRDVESTLPLFLDNLDRYELRQKVVVHFGFTQETLPALRDQWFDFAFLDAQHQREPVREDLELTLPHLTVDAILAFHDYGLAGVEHEGRWDDFHVTEVVDEFAQSRGAEVQVLDTLGVVPLKPA